LETTIELKKLNSDVRIIAISGGGMTDPKIYLNLASKLGAVATFTKPVNNKVLLSTIKEILS
jgi:FixJ family two-component response regulator